MRFRLGKREREAVRDMEAELTVIKLDGRSAIDVVLPELRKLMQTETLLLFAPTLRVHGWELDRFHADNFANASKLRRIAGDFLATAPRRYAWFDALRPELGQRNRPLDALSIIPPGELERSLIYRHLLVPAGLHRDRQPRVLLCEGSRLLAWLGAFHSGTVERRHLQLLAAITPALVRYLATERRIRTGARDSAAIDALLEHIGKPAFVLDAGGKLFELNTAAHAMLASNRSDIEASLAVAATDTSETRPFDVVPFSVAGTSACWLAIWRSESAGTRVASCVAAATRRWRLTVRQGQVLGHLMDGRTNRAIANLDDTSTRAVELHITALFDRLGVDNRTGLVAKVLAL